MITVQDLIQSFTMEVAIAKHLASKIPTDKYDYTPGETSRTVKELLEYMCRMGIAPIALLEGYDPETMKQMRIATEEGDVTTHFEEMMDEQLASIIGFLETATPAYLDEEIELFGMKQARKNFFFEMAVKNFPAYRMQLFTYLKHGMGMSELKTSNLWMGKDS